MHYWVILNSSQRASLIRVSRTILSLSRVRTEEKTLITDQLKSTSTVGPTSSSVSSTLVVDLSFSTGGGGGTSILEGVMTPDFSSCRPNSPRRIGGGRVTCRPGRTLRSGRRRERRREFELPIHRPTPTLPLRRHVRRRRQSLGGCLFCSFFRCGFEWGLVDEG